MKTTISGQLLAESHPLEGILLLIKKFGVQRIDLWPNNLAATRPATPYLEKRFEGRDIEGTKELLKKHGVQAVCLSLDGAYGSISTVPAQYVASFLYALDVAKELDIHLINHYCYHFALGPDADYHPFLKLLEPVIRKAEDLGITLCLENEADDATARPERMLEILQAVGSKAFMTTYDPTNYYHASQEGFPAGYDLVKPYIRYVHLKNGCVYGPSSAIPESRGGTFSGSLKPNRIYYPPINEGAVNISGVIQRLAADGYAIPIALFFATGSLDVAPLALAAKLVGLVSFTWLCGQLFLAAKPWGLDKLLGTRLLYGLHGVLALLGALLGATHFVIKSGLLGVTPTLQTIPGFVALVLFEFTVIGALFLMSGVALPKVRWLASVRKWAQDKLKLSYPRNRFLHNAAAIAVLLLGVHVLAASTTLHSWATTVWMALWFAVCYTLFLVYRIRGRKAVGSA